MGYNYRQYKGEGATEIYSVSLGPLLVSAESPQRLLKFDANVAHGLCPQFRLCFC